jgi:hypothetical protein
MKMYASFQFSHQGTCNTFQVQLNLCLFSVLSINRLFINNKKYVFNSISAKYSLKPEQGC